MNGVSCICHFTGHHAMQWSVLRLLNSNYNSDMTKVGLLLLHSTTLHCPPPSISTPATSHKSSSSFYSVSVSRGRVSIVSVSSHHSAIKVEHILFHSFLRQIIGILMCEVAVRCIGSWWCQSALSINIVLSVKRTRSLHSSGFPHSASSKLRLTVTREPLS